METQRLDGSLKGRALSPPGMFGPPRTPAAQPRREPAGVGGVALAARGVAEAGWPRPGARRRTPRVTDEALPGARREDRTPF